MANSNLKHRTFSKQPKKSSFFWWIESLFTKKDINIIYTWVLYLFYVLMLVFIILVIYRGLMLNVILLFNDMVNGNLALLLPFTGTIIAAYKKGSNELTPVTKEYIDNKDETTHRNKKNKRIVVNSITAAMIILCYFGFIAGANEYKKINDINNSQSTESFVSESNPIEPDMYENFGIDAIFINHGESAIIIIETLNYTFAAFIYERAKEYESEEYHRNSTQAEDKYAEAIAKRYNGMSENFLNDPDRYAKEIAQWMYDTMYDLNLDGSNTRQDEWVNDLLEVIESCQAAVRSAPHLSSAHFRLMLRYIDIADAYQKQDKVSQAKTYRQQAEIEAALAFKYAVINDSDQNKRRALSYLQKLYEIPKGLEDQFVIEKEDMACIREAFIQLEKNISQIKPSYN